MNKAILLAFLVATSMTYYQTLAQEEEISPSPQQFADPIAAAYDHELVGHMTKQHIGKDCHEGLMNLAFSTYELKDIANEILPRSKKIWNQCVQTTAAMIGAPMSLET
ncbi:unnamed protein product [Arabis nemorensis]|uniref:Prolamin-like domain-containing protein n=1 Tax=Arabis nemorensis TaxID=586526 RepID=A0A565BFH9_9BRAS|nr:unnamed protein product [Arabis nemorensis]